MNNINNINIREIENKIIQSSKVNKTNIAKTNQKSFSEVLENLSKNDESIKFSKHASKRLLNRDMNVSLVEMKKLETAFDQAKIKGVKDALIIMDNKAFIANVNSRTIITTMNKQQLKENVFTNIDGAVII